MANQIKGDAIEQFRSFTDVRCSRILSFNFGLVPSVRNRKEVTAMNYARKGLIVSLIGR